MRLYLSAVLLLYVSTACFGQATQVTQQVKWGAVEGVVVDGDRKPLPDATVTSYTQAKGVARDVMQYQANGNGEFSLRLLERGVRLSAHQNSEADPYAFFAFYLMSG